MQKIDNLDKLGILVQGVSPDYIGSSYCNTVSESIGSLVCLNNKDNVEIVWMMTDKPYIGIVVHSTDLVPVGTLTDLRDYIKEFDIIKPFVGTVNIYSKEKE